jgi:hypothetical protein
VGDQRAHAWAPSRSLSRPPSPGDCAGCLINGGAVHSTPTEIAGRLQRPNWPDPSMHPSRIERLTKRVQMEAGRTGGMVWAARRPPRWRARRWPSHGSTPKPGPSEVKPLTDRPIVGRIAQSLGAIRPACLVQYHEKAAVAIYSHRGNGHAVSPRSRRSAFNEQARRCTILAPRGALLSVCFNGPSRSESRDTDADRTASIGVAT